MVTQFSNIDKSPPLVLFSFPLKEEEIAKL